MVCSLLAYVNHLLFTRLDFQAVLHEHHILKVGAVFYVVVVLLFADVFWRRGNYLVFAVWILFNLTVCLNMTLHYSGIYPPLFVQYAQSTTLLIYTVLLIGIREPYPNWFRIYTMANLFVLIPCLIFYFSENWYWYERTVYAICFLPALKALIFFKDKRDPERTPLDVEP